MALKDWKKRQDTPYPAWNKNNEWLTIETYTQFQKNKLKTDYFVAIRGMFGTQQLTPLFKSKSQALKFAKQYMRTH